MRIIGPPPTIAGLTDALALFKAIESVETQKQFLADMQDYLDRAGLAKADADAAKEAAEKAMADAEAASEVAGLKMAKADAAQATASTAQDALNSDKQQFRQFVNQKTDELNKAQHDLAEAQIALKAAQERLAADQQAAQDAKMTADALIAEYTAKIENLKKLAA